jgi:hypothetical protein
MIELGPEAMQLFRLRHWQRRRPGEDRPAQVVTQAPPASTLSAEQALPPAEHALLQKILMAIGEDLQHCEVTVISPRHVSVVLPDGCRLEFDKLGQQRDNRCVHLAGLSAMLANPALKKPVWHQLKQWSSQRKK